MNVFHVLAGEEKDNYDRDSNDQMKPFHAFGADSQTLVCFNPSHTGSSHVGRLADRRGVHIVRLPI